MSERDEGVEPRGKVPDPSSRPWRHPSELAAAARSAQPAPPDPAPASVLWPATVIGACLAVAAAALLTAVGSGSGGVDTTAMAPTSTTAQATILTTAIESVGGQSESSDRQASSSPIRSRRTAGDLAEQSKLVDEVPFDDLGPKTRSILVEPIEQDPGDQPAATVTRADVVWSLVFRALAEAGANPESLLESSIDGDQPAGALTWIRLNPAVVGLEADGVPSGAEATVGAGRSGTAEALTAEPVAVDPLALYALTSRSALGESSEALIQSEGRWFRYSVVAVDELSDMALLRLVEAVGEFESRTESAPGDAVDVNDQSGTGVSDGSIVCSVGAADVEAVDVNDGVEPPGCGLITDFSGSEVGANGVQLFDVIITDIDRSWAPPGSPLTTLDGQVAGIVVTTESPFAVAVPIERAAGVATELAASGAVVRGWLGIETDVDDLGRIVVQRVDENGPCQSRLQVGDHIVAVDGMQVHQADEFVAKVQSLEPGREVTITISRADQPATVTVTVGRRP